MDDDIDDVPFVTDGHAYSYWPISGRVVVLCIIVGILVFLASQVFNWLFG